MLSEKDKINLFGGKKFFCKYLAKRKALEELDILITEANGILDTYKEVDFNNVFITALQQSSRLLFEEQKWSVVAEDCIKKIFNYQQSDYWRSFCYVIPPDAISDYAKIRYRLVEKRKILNQLRDEIKNV